MNGISQVGTMRMLPDSCHYAYLYLRAIVTYVLMYQLTDANQNLFQGFRLDKKCFMISFCTAQLSSLGYSTKTEYISQLVRVIFS